MMEHKEPILEQIASLKPNSILDVGCGCGSFAVKLSPYCGRITAIDLSPALIKRCKKEHQQPNISYLCMDARDLKYPDNSFDSVLEKATLHHIFEWEKVLDEMIRVSSKYLLIEEQVNDPRNQKKMDTLQAQRFFLKLQNEVGHSHYEYLNQKALLGYFDKRNIPIEFDVIRSDDILDFDEYFVSFPTFLEKSKRKDYWLEQFRLLKDEFKDKKLCESDSIFIFADKIKPLQRNLNEQAGI